MHLEKHTDACRQVDELARRVPHAIAAVHHPLFALGAERVCVSPAYPDGIHVVGDDAGVIQVFGTVDARLLPPNVDVLLSGRVHLWEQVELCERPTTQFVSSFAGTAEDTVPLPASALPALGAVVETTRSWLHGSVS